MFCIFSHLYIMKGCPILDKTKPTSSAYGDKINTSQLIVKLTIKLLIIEVRLFDLHVLKFRYEISSEYYRAFVILVFNESVQLKNL